MFNILSRNKKNKIEGRVVLVKKKSSWDLTNVTTSLVDRFGEVLGKRVSLQLISADKPDPGKIGKPTYLEGWISKRPSLTAKQIEFKIEFEWEDEVGIPGAFLIKNNHPNEFFLVSLTLQNVPREGDIHFPCHSWVDRKHEGRIFFRNKVYLPNKTPEPLVKYREQELSILRGAGQGELQEWDRVYDYATYNDLGKPNKYDRPILGDSSQYPYPRRGRTGRPQTKSDPKTESRVKFWRSNYVPRDEQFSPLKNSDFLISGLKSISKVIKAALKNSDEFNSFDEVLNLYEGGYKLPTALLEKVRNSIPIHKLEEIFQIEGEYLLKFPMPHVIKENKRAWMTDEEFARQMLAGVNPVKICRLQEFPLKSKFDGTISQIKEEDLKKNLNGLSVKQAMMDKRLFLLDYYDDFIPYLGRINTTSARAYASTTILFLKNDGTLKPLAIELRLPCEGRDRSDATPEVYLPAEQGVDGWIWNLAKAYVVVNDSSHHQLISHWLHTHAIIEPFVIATNRQLSVLHPIYKLLVPHFRDTMKINALARQYLINANGVIESTFAPGKYAMELSSMIYKNWDFTEQAVPEDLLKRGMAIKDPKSPHNLRLVIEDYPYAVDGLDVWFAIKTWVHDYCSSYYESDEAVQQDSELQSWWKELVEKGHGDKKDEQWWPQMRKRDELIESCTIIIWIASGLHAAVNFGQYAYGGYILNRPTSSRRFMPKKGTAEYGELENNPEKAFLKTLTSKEQTIKNLSVIAILSRHSSTESYLGENDIPGWTSEEQILEKFENFRRRLRQIEERIERDNSDPKLKNRYGLVNVPYTLLYATSEPGLSGKGIPNSISI